jgi:putative DNA primase/helicase
LSTIHAYEDLADAEQRATDATLREGDRAQNSPRQKQGKRVAALLRASDIPPEPIDWAWKDRFAFGKLALIAGDPGLGKSQAAIDIIARCTTGGEFPCGEGYASLCEALILTAEDGLRDTVIPRLIAAGADRSNIQILAGTRMEGAV